MLDSVISALIAGVFSIGTVVYVARQSRRDRKAAREFAERDEANSERMRLEAEAYERARQSYRDALDTAVSQIGRMEKRIEACEIRARRAERRADHSQQIIYELREELRKAGVQIPSHLAVDDAHNN